MSVETHDASPWRSRRFLVFFAGNTFNNIGDSTYAVLLPLLVYDLSGSLSAMAVMAAIGYSSLMFGPLTGALADRIGGQRLVAPAILTQTVLAVVLGVLVTQGRATTILVVAVGGLVEFAGGFYRSGWMASIPQVFPTNPIRSRTALSTGYVSSTIVGPLIVAVMLPVVGMSGLLWFNVVTFVAPLFVLALGVRAIAPLSQSTQTRIRDDMVDGWNTVVRRPRLAMTVLLSFPGDLLAFGATTTFAIFLLRDRFHLGEDKVSWVLLSVSVMALVGSLVSANIRRHQFARMTAVLLGLGAVSLWLLPPLLLPLFIAGLLGWGLADSGLETGWNVLIYEDTPPEKLGRVNGVIGAMRGIPTMLSPLIIALLVAGIGDRGTWVVVAMIASIPPIAVFWLMPSLWRHLDLPAA